MRDPISDNYTLLHGPSQTEVFTVRRHDELRWYALCEAKSSRSGDAATERAALVNLRNQLVGALQAIDARLNELARGGE